MLGPVEDGMFWKLQGGALERLSEGAEGCARARGLLGARAL